MDIDDDEEEEKDGEKEPEGDAPFLATAMELIFDMTGTCAACYALGSHTHVLCWCLRCLGEGDISEEGTLVVSGARVLVVGAQALCFDA